MLIADGLDVGSEREKCVIRERMSLKFRSSHLENGALPGGMGKTAERLACGAEGERSGAQFQTH